MKRSTILGSSVLAATLSLSLGLSSASAVPLAPPDDATAPLPAAVEPEQPALPAEPAPGAPDFSALDAPVSPDGPAAAAPAQAVTAGPRTGFEQRGGADWTTLEEEQALLREIDQATDKVSISRLARTNQGRPVQLVQIGSGPRTPEQVASGSTILLLCLQHGNEPAAREGCLEIIRDLAYDDSPETARLLQRTTVLVIPTVNPDGRAANTRANSEGVDINRDHLALKTVEAQAIARVVRDYRPQVVHDAHEYGGRANVYDRDLIRLWPRNLNVDDDVRELAITLAEDYVDPTVQYEGFTTGDYGIWYGPDGRPIAQVAGNEDERILRNTMGLRHVVGQLIESRVEDRDPAVTPTQNKLRRVRTQVLSLQATLALALEQGPALLTATRTAAQEAAAEGATGDQPFFFAGADNALPSPAAVALEPPCAYTLTVEQFRQVRRTLDLHGVETTRRAGVVTVSMAQAAQPVIPLLLDERANFEVATGTPVAC